MDIIWDGKSVLGEKVAVRRLSGSGHISISTWPPGTQTIFTPHEARAMAMSLLGISTALETIDSVLTAVTAALRAELDEMDQRNT